MSKKKLFLIDGMALIYRAYYALIKNPLISSSGVNRISTGQLTHSVNNVDFGLEL